MTLWRDNFLLVQMSRWSCGGRPISPGRTCPPTHGQTVTRASACFGASMRLSRASESRPMGRKESARMHARVRRIPRSLAGYGALRPVLVELWRGALTRHQNGRWWAQWWNCGKKPQIELQGPRSPFQSYTERSQGGREVYVNKKKGH